MPEGIEEEILRGRVVLEQTLKQALAALEAARKDIIAEIKKQGVAEWKLRYLGTLLARVNGRIDTLHLELEGHFEDMSAKARVIAQQLVRKYLKVSDTFQMIDVDPETAAALENYRANLITRITDAARSKVVTTIRAGILTGLTLGEVEKRLGSIVTDRGVFADLGTRLRTIIRTEYRRELGFGLQAGYNFAAENIPGLMKEWRAQVGHATKPRPEHAAAHGQRVPVNEPFTVGGEKLMFPGDPRASPSLTINCRCESVPVLPAVEEPELPKFGKKQAFAGLPPKGERGDRWMAWMKGIVGELEKRIGPKRRELNRLEFEQHRLDAEDHKLWQRQSRMRRKYALAFARRKGIVIRNPQSPDQDVYNAGLLSEFDDEIAKIEEYAGVLRKRQEISKRLDELRQAITETKAEITNEEAKAEATIVAEWKRIRDMRVKSGDPPPRLVCRNPHRLVPPGSGDVDPKEEWEKASAFMELYLPFDFGTRDIAVQVMPGYGRAFYAPSWNQLNMSERDRASSYVHEMGHVIDDFLYMVNRAGVDELLRRAMPGEKVRRLLETGDPYDPDEWAIFDRFFEPYCGRIYFEPWDPSVPEDPNEAVAKFGWDAVRKAIDSHELNSMGFQYLFQHGHIGSLQRDPELYLFVMKVALDDF